MAAVGPFVKSGDSFGPPEGVVGQFRGRGPLGGLEILIILIFSPTGISRRRSGRAGPSFYQFRRTNRDKIEEEMVRIDRKMQKWSQPIDR